jgi:hypothetical protein
MTMLRICVLALLLVLMTGGALAQIFMGPMKWAPPKVSPGTLTACINGMNTTNGNGFTGGSTIFSSRAAAC